MGKMKIEFDGQVITVELNDSKTTKDFTAKLPLTLKMERYDDREYYSVLDFHPSLDGEHIEDFTNGDVTFFPELNTLAIFFAREGISSQPGLIRMGRITSGLESLQSLKEKIDFKLSVTEE